MRQVSTEATGGEGFSILGYTDGRLRLEQADEEGDHRRDAIAAFGERSLTALLAQETGRDPIGVDLKVNYLERPGSGRLRAEAWLVHRTRRTALAECAVTLTDRPIARVSGTYLLE